MSDVKLSSRLLVASVLIESEETSRLLENAANRIAELERELATARADQRKKDAEKARAHKIIPAGACFATSHDMAHDDMCEDIANAIERGE